MGYVPVPRPWMLKAAEKLPAELTGTACVTPLSVTAKVPAERAAGVVRVQARERLDERVVPRVGRRAGQRRAEELGVGPVGVVVGVREVAVDRRDAIAADRAADR